MSVIARRHHPLRISCDSFCGWGWHRGLTKGFTWATRRGGGGARGGACAGAASAPRCATRRTTGGATRRGTAAGPVAGTATGPVAVCMGRCVLLSGFE